TGSAYVALAVPFDPDAWAAAFAPAVEVVDNRTLGTWSARGVEVLLQHFRSLREVAADVAMRVDDILSLRPDGFLVRRTNFGTDRAGGGAYERPFLVLYLVAAAGLMPGLEFFNADRVAEALARFDELTAPGFPLRGGEGAQRTAAHFENAATRAGDLFIEAWNARDWERMAALFPAGFRNIDRRKMMQVELDREQFLQGCRSFLEMASSVGTQEVLATRGNRLALHRSGWTGADREVGPSEVDLVEVLEVNPAGEHIASVYFDLDDLDAASAELDDRFAAGEA